MGIDEIIKEIRLVKEKIILSGGEGESIDRLNNIIEQLDNRKKLFDAMKEPAQLISLEAETTAEERPIISLNAEYLTINFFGGDNGKDTPPVAEEEN